MGDLLIYKGTCTKSREKLREGDKVRIIDDRETDNLYRTGDVIDGTVSGFHWYDANGYQTVDTGISITVGALTEDGYEITVTRQ